MKNENVIIIKVMEVANINIQIKSHMNDSDDLMFVRKSSKLMIFSQ